MRVYLCSGSVSVCCLDAKLNPTDSSALAGLYGLSFFCPLLSFNIVNFNKNLTSYRSINHGQRSESGCQPGK